MKPSDGDYPFVVLQQGGIVPKGTRVEVFQQIFTVFLALGTAVGVVVIGYMLYNAYKYRDGDGRSEDAGTPRLGELPTGGGGGRKLFFSFGVSTIIVISLIAWTYGTLLYVEENPPGEAEGEESLDIEVVGFRFGWEFVYPNNHTTSTLRVPANQSVHLNVTSKDVFHTFGIPELRVKTDSIPGQHTESWFISEETGTYEARCFELCGAGHSYMTADIVVMEPDEYESWYANTTDSNAAMNSSAAIESNSSSNSSALVAPAGAASAPTSVDAGVSANAHENVRDVRARSSASAQGVVA